MADPNPELGASKSRIGIFTYTKENFSSLTDKERNEGSNPIADESTFSFGKVKAGTNVDCTFHFTNKGKSPLRIYKVDSESSHVKAQAFADVPAGGKGDLKVTFDTKGFPGRGVPESPDLDHELTSPSYHQPLSHRLGDSVTDHDHFRFT